MQIEIEAPFSTCKLSRPEEVVYKYFVLDAKSSLRITMCGLRFLLHIGSSRLLKNTTLTTTNERCGKNEC